ncbi:Ankyrin repeat domain-containing protein 50 [Durusdinium trenchii]|uniref:Ankyrin repeat domain-containing protein 50 n=1 Tax=Durusdinium trenchii TaxID=1381693 RepID=A0ABP0N0X9_9DINO
MPVGRASIKINKDDMFLTVRDAPFIKARQHVAALVASNQCHLKTVMQQTLLFFAAARYGEDDEALELCDTLLRAGVPLNHLDDNRQTALFYAARQGHVNTCNFLVYSKANVDTLDKFGETALFYAVKRSRITAVEKLLDHGADFEIVNHKNHNVMTAASDELCAIFQEARKKRRLEVTEGPVEQHNKRPRSALEQLEAWADEWPMRHPKIETADFKQKDLLKSEGGYSVVKVSSPTTAAKLRVLEKHFVVDHAKLMQHESWFGKLTHEQWSKSVGVLTDALQPPNDAVKGIKTVLSDANPHHFTLPAIETANKDVAGYIHCTYAEEKKALNISHIKVDSQHAGRGIGGLLLKAAEDYSHRLGWKCETVELSVLARNQRAIRCYEKAGFTFNSESDASWGPKEFSASKWQRFKKVHKHHVKKGSKKGPDEFTKQ